MLKLSTREITAVGPASGGPAIRRVTTNANLPEPLRDKSVLLLTQNPQSLPPGFAAYFTLDQKLLPPDNVTKNLFLLPGDQDFLADGDIIRLNPEDRSLRTLYRRNSNQNFLLVTEQCNNFCLMCSQPPKDIDDSYILKDILDAIPLMDRGTEGIIITGGEPSLLGDDLIKILKTLKNYLPTAGVHILSNGRKFSNLELASKVAKIGHPDLMIGIPLYSDVSNIHDYVVQADGAFDETIRGIINLKRTGVKVEVRVVLHRQTYERLPDLAHFLARNLLFVDHVALMGLEMTGFTKHNLKDLWIDPVDYQPQLLEAIETLARYRMHVSIYNHQLCVLDKRLWTYNCNSISDWKNEYMPECEPCEHKAECGGFFSSAKFKYSAHIKPFPKQGQEHANAH